MIQLRQIRCWAFLVKRDEESYHMVKRHGQVIPVIPSPTTPRPNLCGTFIARFEQFKGISSILIYRKKNLKKPYIPSLRLCLSGVIFFFFGNLYYLGLDLGDKLIDLKLLELVPSRASQELEVQILDDHGPKVLRP